MDFMRTLLIYMSATLALAVQSTSAPSVTPLPPDVTATPSALVTDAGAPANGTEEIISPAPGTIPEITPNKAYHNLKQGDKGADVKKLQTRLIELGYLAEGAADGVYGRQTTKAVRRFQAYNGLTQDGIAGRRTQTYLFENPDVVPYPGEATPAATEEETGTPAPTDTPAPTEAPTDTPAPTEAPTDTPAPTEAPTDTPAPTEAPTDTPAPTEAPTDTPAPTEAPTDTPTEVPEETPAPTEEPAKVTEEPVVPSAQPEPTLMIEEIDPAEGDFDLIDGSVAFNENGAPLEWKDMEDGVPVIRKPRLQRRGDRIRVSLDDLASCLEGWEFTSEGTVTLTAEGHRLELYNEQAGAVATVDGIEIPMESDDFDFERDGHFIDAFFLARAMGGEAEWDEEEITLMLRIPTASAR